MQEQTSFFEVICHDPKFLETLLQEKILEVVVKLTLHNLQVEEAP
jgi:hypothetical protein